MKRERIAREPVRIAKGLVGADKILIEHGGRQGWHIVDGGFRSTHPRELGETIAKAFSHRLGEEVEEPDSRFMAKLRERDMYSDPIWVAYQNGRYKILNPISHARMSSIYTAPLEDQVRYVLFKLADAGDAGVQLSGGYLPRDGAREVMRQRLGEAERGILYILPRGYKWIRRNASARSSDMDNRQKVARELVTVARLLTSDHWTDDYQDFAEEAVEDLLGLVRKVGQTKDARAAARFAPQARKKLKSIEQYLDLLEDSAR